MIDAKYYLQKSQLIMKHLNSQDQNVVEWIIQLDETQKQFEENQFHYPLLEQSVQFINHIVIHPFLQLLEKKGLQFLKFFNMNYNYNMNNNLLYKITNYRLNMYKKTLDNIAFILQLKKRIYQISQKFQWIFQKVQVKKKIPIKNGIKYMGGAFFITNIDKARQIQLKEITTFCIINLNFMEDLKQGSILKKLYQILNDQNLISQQNIYSLCIQAYITLVQINQINNEIERGTLFQQEQFKRSDIRKFIQKIDIISIYF
ncbi:unnamed protein product [Paramecium pentaurelia]|uniref:Uncharacterized protein n=1 Tax=Paramecium pentaurelia TaxID=43138 RepID=A0A8S1U1B7_9CILI|nr:unnamed protein product [Paramecium pentaurelia]